MKVTAAERRASREAIRAASTMLALGCADASRIPLEVFRRVAAKILRESPTKYDFGPAVQRRRDATEGRKPFLEALRKAVGIERLPSGFGDRIIDWATKDLATIQARLARSLIYNASGKKVAPVLRSARQATRTQHYVKRAVQLWDPGKRLIGVRDRSKDVLVVQFGEAFQVILAAEPVSRKMYYGHDSMPMNCTDPATGQVTLRIGVVVRVDPLWYGRVWLRKIAVVQDCFVLSADPRRVTPDQDDDDVVDVVCVRFTNGFQVEQCNGTVRLPRDGREPYFESIEIREGVPK